MLRRVAIRSEPQSEYRCLEIGNFGISGGIKDFYDTHGYTPTKDDIDTVVELKARFRTWNNVLLAAGLPDKNDPENQRKRMEAANKKKEAAE